ncbi:uncharacterized protein LOC111803781 [Cucurbita pepo subsp. pepo]|uniref:uncharacterized protein LOC111803781 n=1 Tax=Cucurbita pepo subsp. pepo TaxID=3664 RepID=UPI000C9D349A|nr:uncharacterized protein LOC111803781 [Cucurbita pepo subsp. pepo]
MAEFPCALERTVASALLLLSTSPPPPPSPPPSPSLPISQDEWLFEEKILGGKCSSEMSPFCDDSKSCSSVLTRSDESSETRAQELLLFSTSAYRDELKLNVVRKSRSRPVRISGNRNLTPTDDVTLSSGSASSETTYCLSSSSSVDTSAPIRRLVTRAEKKLEMIRHAWRKKHVASAHMRRRAEAILSYLSGGCSSEVKIRQVLGDSPDTSKALRMLLKLEEIKRSGTGGRQDPYIYTIA